MKAFSAIKAFVVLWLVLVSNVLPLQAQTLVPPPAPATGGWYDQGAGPFDSGDAACRNQFLHVAFPDSNGIKEYLSPVRDSVTQFSCRWNGGGRPIWVALYCSAGAVPTAAGTCVRPETPPECPTCAAPSSSPLPKRGNPVSIATGAKVEDEQDYESADGLFSVSRSYRSVQRAPIVSGDHEVPGFGQAWHGVVPGRVIVAGSNSEIGEYWAEDGTITFFNASTTNLNSYAYVPQGVSRLKLSSVGQPAVSRTDYFKTGASVLNGAGEMRLDFGNGEYVLYRRADTYRLSTDIRFLVPVEHGFPSGYKQWFDYPDTGEYPNRMRDSFGRQAQISWQSANQVGSQISYKVINQIQLPDGSSLNYQYEKAPAKFAEQEIYYAGNPQDRLVSAIRKDAAGTTLWSHSYRYEDLRFGYALTGVVDQNGNRLSTFAYSDAGLAISTQKAGGFQNHTIEYLQSAAGQPLEQFVRNVTGPLGHVERYSFYRSQAAPAGMQLSLTQVDRLASTTVPAASQVYSYTNSTGTDLLVSGIQDPRSTSTTMVVDTANRRPTSITEAAGTSAARTTDTTWHAQFDLPTREVRQGLTTDYTYTASGQLLTRTETDTTTQTIPYSTSGQTRTTTYAWDPGTGRLLSINGPLAIDAQGKDDTVTFTYDPNGM
jgi:Domain of unknown function (DUF6531)